MSKCMTATPEEVREAWEGVRSLSLIEDAVTILISQNDEYDEYERECKFCGERQSDDAWHLLKWSVGHFYQFHPELKEEVLRQIPSVRECDK